MATPVLYTRRTYNERSFIPMIDSTRYIPIKKQSICSWLNLRTFLHRATETATPENSLLGTGHIWGRFVDATAVATNTFTSSPRGFNVPYKKRLLQRVVR